MKPAPEQAMLSAYELHADAIYRHCYFRVHNKEKAEDLVQETFTKTWKYMATNGIPDNIRAFLYKVATNLIIDESRKKKPQSSLEVMQEVGFEPSFDNTDRLFNHLDGKEAVKKLDALEADYKEVLVMRYIDGFRPKEIAEILKVTQNVVSVRLHRAKKQLAQLV